MSAHKNTAHSVSIGITGIKGRMGCLLADELKTGGVPRLYFGGGSVRTEDDIKNTDPEHQPDIFITDNAATLFERTDLIIDFTTPKASIHHSRLAAQYKKPLLIGTTGLSPDQEKIIAESSEGAPILYAANTSIGITILKNLVEKTASLLGPDWDIEICETHHRYKADAPSGTAKMLGAAAAKGRHLDLNDEANFIHERHGHTGPRPKGAIGYAVQRGGDVAGEHSATFFGDGERLALSHKASDRRLFVKGALKGAQWLIDQPPGLYNMAQALSL